MKTQLKKTQKMVFAVGLAMAMLILFNFNAQAQTNDKVAKEVIALAHAQWKADMQNDIDAANANIADEYTEFNSAVPTRIDGKDVGTRLYLATQQSGQKTIAAEMANEKVQVYGDVAILTYNYIGVAKDKDGKIKPNLAKSTRVYAKKGGKWMLVHANFAPVNSSAD